MTEPVQVRLVTHVHQLTSTDQVGIVGTLVQQPAESQRVTVHLHVAHGELRGFPRPIPVTPAKPDPGSNGLSTTALSELDENVSPTLTTAESGCVCDD
jgi:hypothetical protein